MDKHPLRRFDAIDAISKRTESMTNTDGRTLTNEEFLAVQLRYIAMVKMRRQVAKQTNTDPSLIPLDWDWNDEWAKAKDKLNTE